MNKKEIIKPWNLELESKPDFELCMKRIYAWYEGQIIDRAPVRFSAHNSDYDHADEIKGSKWKNLKERWMDEVYHVEKFMKIAKSKKWLGETFPVYWPNLGPNVFASFYDCPMEFGEVTSWLEPVLKEYKNMDQLKFNPQNAYFKQIDKMTDYALERCEGQFMVGYTDLHPGIDCAAAWRNTEDLCMDFYDNYEELKALVAIASKDFNQVFDHYDQKLKSKNQLSVTWMNIPSFGKMHIPSADFSAMISRTQFDETCLPIIQ
ncbi:MAG: hypothetical protein H7X94_02140, partial [Vallitaleaceae bacterium]|nr:hypothetical protein [Vallitaleaceae bacterium]